MAIELKNINPVILDNDVGIGKTPSPGGPKLEVSTTIKLGGGAAANTERLMVNTASGTSAGIQLKQDGQGSWTITNPASATYLTISEGSSPIIRVTSSGDVGIGQTSPGGKLDVNGTIKATSILNAALANPTMTTGTILASTDLGAIQSSGLVFSGSSVVSTKSFTFSLASASLAVTATSGNSSLTMTHNSATNTISFYSGATLKGQLTNTGEEMRHKFDIHSFHNLAGSEKVRITSTGAVGIGTPSPSRSLHVVGDALFSSNLKALGLAASGGIIDFDDAEAGANRLQLAGGNLSLSLGGNTPKFVFTNLSRVGIGTSSPQHALDVVGSIRASTSIIIGNTGAIFPSTATSHTRVMACPIDGARGVYDNDVLWLWDGTYRTVNESQYYIGTTESHATNGGSATVLGVLTTTGGGTFSDQTYYTTTWGDNYMIGVTTVASSVAPTTWVTATLPCDPSVHNVLHVKVISTDRWQIVGAYILNSAGTLQSKLQSHGNANYNSSSGDISTVGPRNSSAKTTSSHEWVSIIIPKAHLTSHAYANINSPTGYSVKIALYNGDSRGSSLYISGLGISRNPTGFVHVNAIDLHWATNGGTTTNWYGGWNNDSINQINARTNYSDIRIPIAGTDRDILIGAVDYGENHRVPGSIFWLNNYNQPSIPNATFYLSNQITGTYGKTNIGHKYRGFSGFVVPKALVQAHVGTHLGQQYLSFYIYNLRNDLNVHFRAMYSEQVNRIGNSKSITGAAFNMKNNNYASNSIVDLATYDGV